MSWRSEGQWWIRGGLLFAIQAWYPLTPATFSRNQLLTLLFLLLVAEFASVAVCFGWQDLSMAPWKDRREFKLRN